MFIKSYAREYLIIANRFYVEVKKNGINLSGNNVAIKSRHKIFIQVGSHGSSPYIEIKRELRRLMQDRTDIRQT